MTEKKKQDGWYNTIAWVHFIGMVCELSYVIARNLMPAFVLALTWKYFNNNPRADWVIAILIVIVAIGGFIRTIEQA